MLTKRSASARGTTGLADLSVLVDGFLALSRAHGRRHPPAAAAARWRPGRRPASRRPLGVRTAESTPAVPSGATGGPRTYSVEDADVTPPVAIFQVTPSVPARAPDVPPDAAAGR